MTDQQPHTPTTEVIRETYIGEPPYTLYGYTEEEFNRWLATVEAAAEQRGAERALREAVKQDRMYNGISFFVPEEALLDRADQEGEQGE